jgi:hypothetical protein
LDSGSGNSSANAVNLTKPEAAVRPRAPRELTKILGDCRDLAIHRLLLSFTTMLDKVSDMLMDRANKTEVRDEQQNFMDARAALKSERPTLMAEFERSLRQHVDDRISGKDDQRADFSKVDVSKLTLVDTSAMDESVVTGNITRVLENACHEELQTFNRGIGFLLGKPDLETAANPLAPATVIESFAEALKTAKADARVKFTILKELNQAPLGEISAIYADLNRHLLNQRVIPAGRSIINRGGPAERGRGGADGAGAHPGVAPPLTPEMDIMAMFRRAFGGAPPGAGFGGPMAAPGGGPSMPQTGVPDFGGGPQMPPMGAPDFGGGPVGPFGMPAGGYAPAGGGMGGDGGPLDFPSIDMGGNVSGMRYIPSGPLPMTPSGYVPGAPIIATPMLGEGLARLQAGESGFDLGGGAVIQFSGIPQGKHNVLRDLQESPLGQKVNQLESMTIELVAMLFDFIFET